MICNIKILTIVYCIVTVTHCERRMWRLVKSRSICFKYYRYYCTNQISKTFNLMIRSLPLFHDNQKGKQSQILPYPYRFTKKVKIVQWNNFVFPLCFTSKLLSKTVILTYLGDKQYDLLKMYIHLYSILAHYTYPW